MGKSHSPPNLTDASCIKHSLVKVSTFVSSTSLVQKNKENRIKKLCMKTALSVISARKTKDHYRCQMGVISFSRNIAIYLIISHFFLSGGDIFCSERDSYC